MMSPIEFLLQPIWQRLGLTLLHFLWQGLLVAIVARELVQLSGLRHGTPRYAAYLVAFLIMTACPIGTFLMLGNRTHVDPTRLASRINPERLAENNSQLPTAVSAEPNAKMQNLTTGLTGELAENDSPIPRSTRAAGSPKNIPAYTRLGRELGSYFEEILPWSLMAWSFGVSVLSVRLLIGFAGICCWRCRLEPLPENLKQRVISLSERLCMPGFWRVFTSSRVSLPMAVGCFRPVVLLPAAMLTQIPPEMLEAMIAHELAHIRRFDPLVNLVQRVVETLLFYHPAVWWLSNRLRSEREFCCDELAVKVTENRSTYASALEHTARTRIHRNSQVFVTGFGKHKKIVLARIRHILGLTSTSERSPRWLGWLGGIVTLAVVIMLGIFAQAAVVGPDARADIEDTSHLKNPALRVAEQTASSRGSAAARNLEESLEWNIWASKEMFYPGEAVLLTIEIKNTGEQEAKIDFGADGIEAFSMEIRDHSNQVVAKGSKIQRFGMSRVGYLVVNPGTTVRKSIVLNQWCSTLLPPGRYHIACHVEYRFPSENREQSDTNTIDVGPVHRIEFGLDIILVETDNSKFSEVLEGLVSLELRTETQSKKEWLVDRDLAREMLCFTESALAVPYQICVLKVCQYTWLKRDLINSLVKSGTVEAANGLVQVLEAPSVYKEDVKRELIDAVYKLRETGIPIEVAILPASSPIQPSEEPNKPLIVSIIDSKLPCGVGRVTENGTWNEPYRYIFHSFPDYLSGCQHILMKQNGGGAEGRWFETGQIEVSKPCWLYAAIHRSSNDQRQIWQGEGWEILPEILQDLGDFRSDPQPIRDYVLMRRRIPAGTVDFDTRAKKANMVIWIFKEFPGGRAEETIHTLLGEIVYLNNFEQTIGKEWSVSVTDTTPLGSRRFLGQFGNESVQLRLGDLPSHLRLTLSFDLFTIRSWDGNGRSGPDVWELNVEGGPTLLHTTFSNSEDNPSNDRQAYPGIYPGGDNLARTGAAEVNTLGYGRDSCYQLEYTFAHSASTLVLNFSARGTQPILDESWGLDNVKVTATVAKSENASATLQKLEPIGETQISQ